MKTQSITFVLLLFALCLTSCKNTETPANETPIIEVGTSVPDSASPQQINTVKDSLKYIGKQGRGEKEENEANEKNEK